jgi:hypothetical protein
MKRSEAFGLLFAMTIWPLLMIAWKVRKLFTRGDSRLRGQQGAAGFATVGQPPRKGRP